MPPWRHSEHSCWPGFGATVSLAQQAGGDSASGIPSPVRNNGCVTGAGNLAQWGVCDSKVFSPADYGAVGDGNPHAIGATYGSTLAAIALYTAPAGGKPFSFVTTPTYGLTFPLTTSADQGGAGTVLTFLTTLTGIGGWSAPGSSV